MDAILEHGLFYNLAHHNVKRTVEKLKRALRKKVELDIQTANWDQKYVARSKLNIQLNVYPPYLANSLLRNNDKSRSQKNKQDLQNIFFVLFYNIPYHVNTL